MYRTIYSYLSSKTPLSSEQKYQLSKFLQKNFFRSFKTSIVMNPIISSIQTHEYKHQTIIFDQGQDIERYYFLIDGKIFIQKIENKQGIKESHLVEPSNIVGEYFYDQNIKRASKAGTILQQNSTLLISIGSKQLERHYSVQIEQYSDLRERVSKYTEVSSENLDSKGMFRNISYHKYRFGDDISGKALTNKISIILSGQCILSHSGAITLIEGDYINLQGYFAKKELNKNKHNSIKYRVNSSELQICSLGFDFIDKLPEQFRQKLLFVYKCHEAAPSSYLNLSSLKSSIQITPNQFMQNFKKKKLILPRLKREVTFNKNDKTFNGISQLQSRITHKVKRSPSANSEKQNQDEKVQQFRKQYCLGYSGPKEIIPQRSRVVVKEPKGYFEIPEIKRPIIDSSFEHNHREWSTYLNQKSKSKTKQKEKQTKSKYTSKQLFPSSFALRVKQILTKFDNNQNSKSRLSKTKSQFIKTRCIQFTKK